MRRKLVFALVLASILALVVAGVAGATAGGFRPVDPDSPNADEIDDAYWLVFGFAAFIFVLVEGALLLFMLRFRNRGRPREVEGPQIRGHTKLEIAWTAVPVLILAFIAGFVLWKLPGIHNVPSASAADRIAIEIEGRQFYWQYRYPNGVVAIDKLRVPAHRVVELTVFAPRNDVIHSWWVPALGGKLDAIPGRKNHTWFRATQTGFYRGRCAEFCGIQHAAMQAGIEVMQPDSFDSWLRGEERRQVEGTSNLGQTIYQGVCAKCHGISGEGLVGPPIKGNPLLSDRQGMETLVRNGRGEMPAVGADWDDREIDALLNYLKRFGGTGAASGS